MEIYTVFWFDKEIRESGEYFAGQFSMMKSFKNLENAKEFVSSMLEEYKNRLGHCPDLQNKIKSDQFEFSEYGLDVFAFDHPFTNFHYIKCLDQTYIIVKHLLY